MTDLREKVARALAEKAFIRSYQGDPNHTIRHFEWYIQERWSLYLDEADAAIAAVLEALKEPTEAMVQAGGNVHTYDIELEKAVPFGHYAAASIYPVMIQTFTRDHYLSALAEEDGKEL